jgi:hypothetical protein
MPVPHDELLTSDELRSLLGAWGLTIGPDSPLVGLPASTDKSVGDELSRRGLLFDEWGRALRAITSPSATLRVLQPLPDMVAVRAMYTDSQYPDLVGCWPSNGKVRIGFPYSAVGEVHDASAALTADFPAQIDPLRVDLSVASLACLAAAVDVLRRSVFESILARRGRAEVALTEIDLNRAYDEGVAGTDARWLVTLLYTLMPMSAPMPDRLPVEGIGELVRHQLLETNGRAWQAAPSMQQLAGWLTNPLPALAHEVVVLKEREPYAYRYLIALRGNGPVWTVEFWKDDPPSVTLRSRTGSGYRRVLASVLAPLEETSSVESESMSPDAAHDEYPPAPFVAPEPRDSCPGCGADIKPSAKFCVHCGAALDQA